METGLGGALAAKFFSNTTFEYDGSSWTSAGAGITPREYDGNPIVNNYRQVWNGSAWTEIADLGTAGQDIILLLQVVIWTFYNRRIYWRVINIKR